MELYEKAITVSVPVVIKAVLEKGRRIVTVEASNESVDSEGDVILQKALLGSAKSFCDSGHLDIDHLSEIGHRIGIKNPEWYIVGRPLEAYDGGDGRTFVKGEIRQSDDGSFDPMRPYDMLWDGLTSTPPVVWYASIYGYPHEDQTIDCKTGQCKGESEASRYLIKGIDWTSLAFTRRPVNQALKGRATIVTAKALIKSIQDEYSCWVGGHIYEPTIKSPPTSSIIPNGTDPEEMDDRDKAPVMRENREKGPEKKTSYGIPGEFGAIGMSHIMDGMNCMKCSGMLKAYPSLGAWRNHLIKCCGMPEGMADIGAHAAMYKHILTGIGGY